MGSDINDHIANAMHGEKPDRYLARVLEGVKEGHQRALDSNGAKFGQLYTDAKKAWVENVVPWEDPKAGGRLLKQFMNNPTPDQAMSALLKAKSEDKLDIFVKRLSPDGKAALQAGLVEDVVEQSKNAEGVVMPEKFLGALKQRQEAYNLAFSGEEKWRVDGLKKLLSDAKFTAQFFTGEWIRSIPGGRTLPGSAFPTPGAGSILQKLFTSKHGQKFLLDASALKPGSAAMNKLIESEMPKVIGIRAGAGSAPALVPGLAVDPKPTTLADAYKLPNE